MSWDNEMEEYTREFSTKSDSGIAAANQLDISMGSTLLNIYQLASDISS